MDKLFAIKRASRSRSAAVLLFVLGGLVAVAFWTGPPALARAPKRPATALKQPNRLTRRYFKPVCGTVATGHARCFAQVVTDKDGNIFTATPAAIAGYGPAQFHTAYQLPCTPGGPVQAICATPTSFGPQTIAIVDDGNLTTGGSTVASSLALYDQNFGLPACTAANGCLTVVNQSGATSPLPASEGWDSEIALDVESAHMICQTCKIVLVEASTSSDANLSASNNTAATFNPVAISNSWGNTSSNDTSLDADYNHPGIAMIASTGDSGAVSNGVQWPADNPNMLAVSGTSLNVNSNNTWASETVWAGSGGGCNPTYAAPASQLALPNWTSLCGTKRAYGDVAADANPSTGMAIVFGGTWYEYGGTSLSAPLVAGMIGLVGKVPAGVTASTIPYQSNNASNFRDIVSGNDCDTSGQAHCTAAAGFDTPSGFGTPLGVGGFSPPPAAPTNVVAGFVDQTHLNVAWTAATGNVGITSYLIFRNGVQVGTSTTAGYNDSGLAPNTNYTYSVIAVDILGNRSPASAVSAAIGTYSPEDINQDGHINLFDFSLFALKYGQTGAGLGRADINGDGVVNVLDLSLISSKYGSE